MKKPFTLLTLAVLLAAQGTCAIAGPVLERIRQSGKIVLAHRDSSVPLSYIDSAAASRWAMRWTCA
jgi:glutamate/aspartate transport system substrate-binding protein